ncbi:MAG: hypothetical protein E7401_00740 [Ruminococcaceae bacterium]|nr:hypothetical protein [Oscillospiraceae bacterium]
MTSLSNGFVCVMGIGTVFVGLICIVFICMLMSVAVRAFSKKAPKQAESAPVTSATPQAVTLPPAEKQAIVAGVCAVIAEELGTDVSNIKVLSFKKA